MSMMIAVTMATKASAPNRPPTRAGVLTPLEFCSGSLDSRSEAWIPVTRYIIMRDHLTLVVHQTSLNFIYMIFFFISKTSDCPSVRK